MMNLRRTINIFGFTLFMLFSLNHSYAKESEKIQNASAIMKESVLRHVVLFKFKKDTTDEHLKAIETSFSMLPDKISQILDFEWGLNNSPEGLEKGFTHCFFVTFKSEENRAIYLTHPDHKAFVDLATPYIEDVLVVDYWTN